MTINTLLHMITFTFLLTLIASSSNPPQYSPSPSPSLSPSPQSGSDKIMASPPSNLISDRFSSPSPSPSPLMISDVSDEVKGEDVKETSSGGMSGGKKAGVAFGLIAAACFVGFGGFVYRKRQDNIRRARYSQSARLEFF